MIDYKKQYKIALVLYSQGLDYDDRIRKEILSIQSLYPNVRFKIFAVVSQNREEEGVTSYGVPYRIPYLKTRDKYPQASHVIAKAWDFYKSVKDDLKQFDAVWCADVETFFFVLMIQGKPMAWDLHELPERLMNNWWTKLLFLFTERKLRVMIHANEPRLSYLKRIGMIKYPEKQFVLRNYPDFNEIDSEYDDTYFQFEKWLGEGICVYLQGLSTIERADEESIGAVLSVPGLKAVVVGSLDKGRMEYIEKKFGKDVITERLFFTGMQKQLKTPQYIRKCVMSLIFYKNTSLNNWYCEPNRLYQNLINGNPVVVGCNPPMKEIVDKYRVGVCANTDGTEIEKIVFAIKSVLNDLECYKETVSNLKSKWVWNSQESMIKRIVEKIFR